jgi:enoyl-CoA hydratase/carnithine racemase
VAAELMLTGRFLHAPRARELGLVSEVCPAGEIEARASSLVEELLRADPQALGLTKHGIQAGLAAATLEAAVELEDRQQALLVAQPAFRARVRAFLRRVSGG